MIISQSSAWRTWRNIDLIDDGVLEIGDGYRAKNSEMGTIGLPFARAGNVNNGFHFEDADILDEKSVAKAGSKISCPGDVVLTSKGTFGRFELVRPETPKFVYSPQLCYWRIKKPLVIDPRFLFFWIQGSDFWNQAYQVKGLTDMADYISLRDQRNMTITAPPLPVQKKIAAVLSAYDDLIENNDRRITLLENMAEEIYREWFVRLRFPGHEQVVFHKGLPEGWKVSRIETLCKEVRAGAKIKNLDSNTKYLGLEHLPRKSILVDDFDTVNSVQSDKLLFKERDILFGKIRPYLHKVVLIHFPGACSSDTIVIRPKSPEHEGFLLFTIFSDTFIELATISSKGTKMPRADWSFLKKLEIVLPNQETLEKYQREFETYFVLMCKYSSSNALLKQTRDRLLTRLISGKLSVEDLGIQFPPSMTDLQ